MNNSKLVSIVYAYLSQYDGIPQETIQQQHQLKKLTLQLLSSGEPISAADFAAQSQLPADQIKLQFEMMKNTGY